MHKVEGSSAIAGLEMKGDDLRVHFASGKCYEYAGCGQEKMTEMINSDSPGRYFAQNIRNEFEGVLVEPEVTTDDALPE